jgi:hypothetical protein
LEKLYNAQRTEKHFRQKLVLVNHHLRFHGQVYSWSLKLPRYLWHL